MNSLDALNLWKSTVFDIVKRGDEDLSNRQMAIFLIVYMQAPPHTVKALSTGLSISKPAVTRALDKLSDLGFIKRKIDDNDNRVVHIQRTVKGSVFLREFGDLIASKTKASGSKK